MMRGSLVLFALAATLAGGAFAQEKKAGNAAKGKEVFEAQCAVCHDATGSEKKTGPALKGLFQKAKMSDGKKVTEATVRAKINAGGNGMPGFEDSLSKDEMADLIAYLKTI